MFWSSSPSYVLELFSKLCSGALLQAMFWSSSPSYVLELFSKLCSGALLQAMFWSSSPSFVLELFSKLCSGALLQAMFWSSSPSYVLELFSKLCSQVRFQTKFYIYSQCYALELFFLFVEFFPKPLLLRSCPCNVLEHFSEQHSCHNNIVLLCCLAVPIYAIFFICYPCDILDLFFFVLRSKPVLLHTIF